jgi:hypothetical protein
VVGEDKEKEFVKNGKWYWKTESSVEIKAKLAKFFFRLGKPEISQKSVNISPSSFKKTFSNSVSFKHNIQTKILSVIKSCLTDFSKIFY